MLDVPQTLLDLLHGALVARVLAHVVAELDGGAAGGGGDLDDDVERDGFLAVGFAGEVVCGSCNLSMRS